MAVSVDCAASAASDSLTRWADDARALVEAIAVAVPSTYFVTP